MNTHCRESQGGQGSVFGPPFSFDSVTGPHYNSQQWDSTVKQRMLPTADKRVIRVKAWSGGEWIVLQGAASLAEVPLSAIIIRNGRVSGTFMDLARDIPEQFGNLLEL